MCGKFLYPSFRLQRCEHIFHTKVKYCKIFYISEVFELNVVSPLQCLLIDINIIINIIIRMAVEWISVKPFHRKV